MTISQSDLDSFHQFASQEIVCGGGERSLEELLQKWRQEREQAETVASVRRGVADSAAGRVKPLADVDAEIRVQLGFPERG